MVLFVNFNFVRVKSCTLNNKEPELTYACIFSTMLAQLMSMKQDKNWGCRNFTMIRKMQHTYIIERTLLSFSFCTDHVMVKLKSAKTKYNYRWKKNHDRIFTKEVSKWTLSFFSWFTSFLVYNEGRPALTISCNAWTVDMTTFSFELVHSVMFAVML